MTTIEKIHAEFDTAETRLLEQAKKQLNLDVEIKGRRLKNLGFINSPSVKKLKPIELSKAQVNQIEQHQVNYPNIKYITQTELDKICKKWGLIHAPIDRYVKDVPNKNIEEIENAKPLLEQHTKGLIERVYIYTSKYVSDSGKFKKVADYFGGTRLKREQIINRIQQLNVERDVKDCIQWAFEHNPADLFWYIGSNVSGYDAVFSNVEIETTDKSGLFIAAPPSHFDLKGTRKKGVFGYFRITKQEIQDPVVFRYCSYGIHILSKWGHEAEDELLINPKQN